MNPYFKQICICILIVVSAIALTLAIAAISQYIHTANTYFDSADDDVVTEILLIAPQFFIVLLALLFGDKHRYWVAAILVTPAILYNLVITVPYWHIIPALWLLLIFVGPILAGLLLGYLGRLLLHSSWGKSIRITLITLGLLVIAGGAYTIIVPPPVHQYIMTIPTVQER